MGRLADWMTEAMWAKVRALEMIPEFQKLGDDMQQDHDDWLIWFNLEKPDQASLPGEYGTSRRTKCEPIIFIPSVHPFIHLHFHIYTYAHLSYMYIHHIYT